MEIVLTSKQSQIISEAVQEQNRIKAQAELEFFKVQKRIDSVVEIVLEPHGIAPVSGIQFVDGKLIIPTAESVQEPIAELKESAKKKDKK